MNESGHDTFTTIVGRGTIAGRRALVILAFDDDLEYVGRLEKAGQVATRKDRIRCSQLSEIAPQISMSELKAELPPAARRHFGFGMLGEGTGRATIAALRRLRPDLNDTLDTLLTEPDYRRDDAGFAVAAMEKDAVAVALDLTDIERDQLGRWREPTDSPHSFLSGLEEARLREDQIIAHDLGVFGDWEVVDRSAVGAVTFSSGDRSLTVVNVNRTPVEESLGVDLVYYNEHYHAFVMVQYKRMARERSGGWLYRPDGNHKREVRRMEQIPSEPAESLDGVNYRLSSSPCYFKLCESVVFDPATTDLLRGMYLPLDYMAACKSSAQGPRGGSAYGYSTVPRHLNNTAFVHLVQDGWIGSAGRVSDELRAFVEARVRDGRSVVLAVGRRPPRRAARR